MKLFERNLRRVIRGLIFEKSDYYKKKLDINLGDIISIDNEDTFIKSYNSGIDIMLIVGGIFKVVNLYPQEGDEKENPMMFCEVEDNDSGERIKYIPCYSSVISVVERSEQMNDLDVGDLLYVIDIQENYFRVKNIQEKLGTTYRIVKIKKHSCFKDTRFAFVVPEMCDDDNMSEMLIVPLVEGYVKRV